jgi:hypothetical protein
MSENPAETIRKLEELAAWHRINADYAGADWVWEARLRSAEDLERQAAEIRARLPDHRLAAENDRNGIHGSGRAPTQRDDPGATLASAHLARSMHEESTTA